MKLPVVLALALPLVFSLPGVHARLLRDNHRGADHSRGAVSAVSPKDLARCVTHAHLFILEPMHKALAIERATDHCAVDKKVDDRNYFCPHFKEALVGAFKHEPSDKDFTPESFCQVSEDYMLQMRGATRVPNMGSGPLLNFKLSKGCEQATASALAPGKKLPSKDVPDFWYSICINQDCGHLLPSRTRWCDVDRQPTHSVAVCEALRDFSKDEVSVVGGEMSPGELCHMYTEFVEEIGVDVEAYEHVLHYDQPNRVPAPSDTARALQSSQMVNAAGKHRLRDNAGQPVEKV